METMVNKKTSLHIEILSKKLIKPSSPTPNHLPVPYTWRMETMANKKTSLHIEILSKKLIKPSSPTPNHLRKYNLSFIDQFAHRGYGTLVYFYRNEGNANAAETSRRIEQLEKSLSKVLVRYYPLAGRLAGDLLWVDCGDQGAVFRVAKINFQLNEYLKQAQKDAEMLSCLAPRSYNVDDLGSEPLCRVQISMFECGGLAVTVENLHTVVDGFRGAVFASEWAKINVSATIKNIDNELDKFPAISFDSGSILPRFDLSTKLKPNPPSLAGSKLVAKILLFDGAAISRLKDEVKEIAARPSKVEVVTAFVWSRLIRAAQARNNGRLRASKTCQFVNLRGRTKCGEIQPNYFGNMYIPIPIVFVPDETKMELHHFVLLIREAVQKTLSDCAEASKDDLASIILNAENGIRERPGGEETDRRLVSSLCRFPLYETDFGWGKPYWVSVLKIVIEMFFLMDTKCGKGVEVCLFLNEIEMRKLDSDPYMAPFI